MLKPEVVNHLRNWRYMKQFVLLSKEEAAEIADLLEGKTEAADLQRENAALREQDELHWKTRKTLVAENAALQQELVALREFARDVMGVGNSTVVLGTVFDVVRPLAKRAEQLLKDK